MGFEPVISDFQSGSFNHSTVSSLLDVQKAILCLFYDFMFEKYLIDLPDALKYIVCKFRSVDHKLPIETGRYTRIPRNERVCKMCNSGQLGDEFHFCLECPALKELRNTFLPANIYKRPNVINFGRILNIKNKITLVNVAKFIKFGLDMCTH